MEELFKLFIFMMSVCGPMVFSKIYDKFFTIKKGKAQRSRIWIVSRFGLMAYHLIWLFGLVILMKTYESQLQGGIWIFSRADLMLWGIIGTFAHMICIGGIGYILNKNWKGIKIHISGPRQLKLWS